MAPNLLRICLVSNWQIKSNFYGCELTNDYPISPKLHRRRDTRCNLGGAPQRWRRGMVSEGCNATHIWNVAKVIHIIQGRGHEWWLWSSVKWRKFYNSTKLIALGCEQRNCKTVLLNYLLKPIYVR